MKIALIVIGKTDAGYFVEAINEYKNRLVHYILFEMEVIPDIKNVKNLSEVQQKEKEGELILKTLQSGDYLVLLDDKGKEFTSMQFSAYIEKKMHMIPKRLVFVVGGPYGFSEAVYKAAKYFKSHNKRQKQGLERKKASKDYPYRLIFYTI